jgi:hypothetical protein
LVQAIQALSLPVLGTPWTLEGDWMIVGDVRIPFTKWEFALRAAEVAKRKLDPPRRLLVAGDWWDFGNYSVFDDIVPPPTWGQERDAGKLLAQVWGETFQEIRFLMGNHERRKERRLDGNQDDEDIFSPLASVVKDIKSSNHGFCYVISGGQKWLITHPKQYSQKPLSVVNDLALKFSCNVVGWHEHHFGITWAKYGPWVVVNGGGLFDDEKFAYVQIDQNTRPKMRRGFVLLKGGVARLYGEAPFTDWSRYE